MYVGRLESTVFKDVFGKGSFLKLGGDILNSRDDKGTNISQTLNLLVNSDGSLSPFVLPGADERTAWSVDAWLKMGPFDLSVSFFRKGFILVPSTECLRVLTSSRRTDST